MRKSTDTAIPIGDQPEKKKSLAQTVYKTLLGRIVNGEWMSGIAYDRRSVAKELGVSMAPVSEAMIRLEKDGFLVCQPRKGTMLRHCDPRRLYENLILREALECEALRLIFQRKSRGKLTQLREAAKRADGPAGPERSTADARFHKELVDLAQVGELSAQLERIRMHIIFNELRLLEAGDRPVDSHCALLQALTSTNSAEVAVERLRQHIRTAREGLFNRFEEELEPSPKEKNQS